VTHGPANLSLPRTTTSAPRFTRMTDDP
jgi:hypothetical protein